MPFDFTESRAVAFSEPSTPEIKIIAMSGGGTSHNLMFLDVARAFGADAVLAKPFKPGELKDTVEQVLNGQSRAAE